MKRIFSVFALLLPLIFLFSVYLTNFSAPFRSFDEDNGYLFGGVARAHLFFGLKKTYGQDFFYEGMGKELIPYLRHPPGVGLSLALILRFLNFGDLDRPFWQERLLPTFYTMATYFIIFFLTRRLFKSLKGALISVLLFVLTPMSLYYGRMVSHEPPTLFFLLLTSFFYVEFQKKKRNFLKYGFFASLFFSCLYGWPGFYFIPVVLFLDFIDFKKRRLKISSFFRLLAFYEIFLLAFFFGQIFIANKFSFQPTIELIQEKNALPYEGGVPYFKIPWMILLARRYLRFFTPILAIPGGIYLLYLAFKKISGRITKNRLVNWQRIALIFFFISLIHIFVWRFGSYSLPYWQIYFLPALIFSSTYLFLKGEEFLKKFTQSRIWSIVYYLIIFAVLITQSQPVVASLFTRGGEFPFPHFYIIGF